MNDRTKRRLFASGVTALLLAALPLSVGAQARHTAAGWPTAFPVAGDAGLHESRTADLHGTVVDGRSLAPQRRLPRAGSGEAV